MPLVKTVPSQPGDTARRQQAAPRYLLEINWTAADAGEFSQHTDQADSSRLESVRVALTKPGTTTGNTMLEVTRAFNQPSRSFTVNYKSTQSAQLLPRLFARKYDRVLGPSPCPGSMMDLC